MNQDQFEPGEDVTDEFDVTRKPTGMVVSVRLAPEDANRLSARAEETGMTVSQLARQAIRSFLNFGGGRRTAIAGYSMEVASESSGWKVVTPLDGPRTQAGDFKMSEPAGNGVRSLSISTI